MGMLEIFYPDETADTSYGIDYEALYRKGYRGLIYDVDNPLVPHGAPADDRAKALFERLHTIGFSAVLLSNNKEPRVKSFAEDVKYADYIFKADKPSVKGYEEAMRRMGTHFSLRNILIDEDKKIVRVAVILKEKMAEGVIRYIIIKFLEQNGFSGVSFVAEE